MKEIMENNFDEEVINSEIIVVADFWAPWCGPCKMLTPILEELDREIGNKVKFVKINVDENPIIANKFEIASIPNVIVFKNGDIVENIVGFRPKIEFEKIIQNNL
jgi:thioredoxin